MQKTGEKILYLRKKAGITVKEIQEVFIKKETTIENDTDIGFFGDEVGVCPLCKKRILRGRYSYGCEGYNDGCKFKIPIAICKRNISLSNAKMLLETGKSSEIAGFISKTGKPFNAVLKLENDGVRFDF